MPQTPTIDSDPGPAGCGRCGDTYTKWSDANRGVCPDCWSEITTCPDCGGVRQLHQDVCDDCACDHPAAYVDDSGEWDVQRCVECNAGVNFGGVEDVPLRG